MTRTIMVLPIMGVLVVCTHAPAQNPPPSVVASTVSNLWANQNFSGLNLYITNLYVTSSNYVPAILASSFHDSIYLGRMSVATNKLARVEAFVASTPESFTVEFKDLLGELQSETKREIELHALMGTPSQALESNASPQTVRNAWGYEIPPQISILYYAPATNAP